MKIIADLSVEPHFALSASFGHGDGDRLQAVTGAPPGRVGVKAVTWADGIACLLSVA
jgi:hypothetical protein